MPFPETRLPSHRGICRKLWLCTGKHVTLDKSNRYAPESNWAMLLAVASFTQQYVFCRDTAVHGIQGFVTISAAEAELVVLASSRSLHHFCKVHIFAAPWAYVGCSSKHTAALCSHGRTRISDLGDTRDTSCCRGNH